ncbi:MAG: DUF3987 domain-containing protein [Planctomycetota bacterium]|nr:DUF3987 domain-containing protein [Planctomycetota bacterium]
MNTTKYDAWLVARLYSGVEVNGEAAHASKSGRLIISALIGKSGAERDAAWTDILASHDDPNGFAADVRHANPHGPAPPPDDPADDWPTLRISSLPDVEPFPIYTLPDPAAQLVLEGANAMGCAPDFLGLAVLVMAAGAIGRSVSLRLKDDYFASSCLFGALIGPPGDGKSPALEAAAKAIHAIDEALWDEHSREMDHWRIEGDKSKPPPKPRRIDVDDFTMESLPSILNDNPRGLVAIKDELSALVLGLNQYKSGKGSDRSNLLKVWSGKGIKRDRVSNENRVPVRCPFPYLSIVGCLTSDMVGELADPRGRADGFIDRFLFVYPDVRPVADWSDRGVSDLVARDWRHVVRSLFDRPMRIDPLTDRLNPHVTTLTDDGQSAWREHHAAHVAEMNGDGFPSNLRGPWSKFREYAGRLSLILALLDHASKPDLDYIAVPDVGRDVVNRAWRLIDYFKSHSRRVNAATARGRGLGGGPVVDAVVRWIRDCSRGSFTLRDFKQDRRGIDAGELDDAIKYLEDRHALRPITPVESERRPGRPSRSFEVNPALLDTQNPQNTQNTGE